MACVLNLMKESTITLLTKPPAIVYVHHKCVYLVYALDCAYDKYHKKKAVFWKEYSKRVVEESKHLPMGWIHWKNPEQ
eukprot:15326145-Ditylum_brightwellii.AAC.1